MHSLPETPLNAPDNRPRGRGSLERLARRGLLGAALALSVACAAGQPRQQEQPGQPSAASEPEITAPAAEDKVAPGLVASRPAVGPAPNGADSAKPEQADSFFCYVEILTADRPSVYGYMAPRGCMPSGAFKRGERMVFRFEVVDLATGKKVTAREAADIALRVPYHTDVPAEYKQRGEGRVPDAPWTWDVCWDVPLDYPQGTLDYAIAITLNDGRQGLWKPPAFVDPSRGIDTRPQIIE